MVHFVFTNVGVEYTCPSPGIPFRCPDER